MKFKTAQYLKNHIVLCHSKEKNYKCTLCEKSFAKARSLALHMISHSKERPHKCPHCDKSFSYKATLKGHIQIHTGNKSVCKYCPRMFTTSYHLTHHMKKMHADVLEKSEDPQMEIPKEVDPTEQINITSEVEVILDQEDLDKDLGGDLEVSSFESGYSPEEVVDSWESIVEAVEAYTSGEIELIDAVSEKEQEDNLNESNKVSLRMLVQFRYT